MANAWDISDVELVWELDKVRLAFADIGPLIMCLYQNDYTPIPGTDSSDFTEANFPGYEQQEIDPSTWAAVTIDAHVASTTNSTPCEFEADATGFVSQNIYGYYVFDEDDELIWSERFATMRVVKPEDILKINAVRRLATFPNPT